MYETVGSELTVGVAHELVGVADEWKPLGSRNFSSQLVEPFTAHPEVGIP